METTAPITTAPNTGKGTRIANKVQKVVAVLAILVVAMVYFGQKIMKGTRYMVSDKESVNYSGDATEDEAKRLGEVLKSVEFFTGTKELDVLFRKDESEGVVVSFVLNGQWKDEEIVSAFRVIGGEIMAAGLGKPLTIKLIDEHMNTENEFKLE